MKRRLSTLALGAAAFMLLLAGCTPQAPQETGSQTPPETVSQAPLETVSPVCAAVDNLDSSLEEFRNTVTPEVTAEELRAARDKVKISFDALAAEAQDLARDQLKELNAEIDRFQAAVEDVSNGATVQDATDALRNETDAVDASLNDLQSELTC
jgi:uncharacterized lipoprotein YajG